MSETRTSSPKLPKTEREKEQEAFRKTCDAYIQKGLTRNPTIQFLIDRLLKLGCEPPKGFIKCMDCGDRQMGGGFGVVEETIMKGNGNEQLVKEAEERQTVNQCLRTEEDLRAQLKAQKEGKATLKLLPEIFLCQQHIRNEVHAHQSMAHELIHAIDLCRYVVSLSTWNRIY